MERIWSPWRSHFINSPKDETATDSPFTLAFNQPERDQETYLLHRGTLGFIILNRYPYNAGHLLILPVRQVADLLELTPEEGRELFELTQFGVRILQRAMNPHGFNIGMNLGRPAGAGILNHVHIHIVPRWNGDTNFMPVLDETRVISEQMETAFAALWEAKEQLLKEEA